MANESLPQSDNGGPMGDGRCCGPLPVHLRGPMTEAVASMADPPRTTDRWHLTWKWQCHYTAEHNGTITETRP